MRQLKELVHQGVSRPEVLEILGCNSGQLARQTKRLGISMPLLEVQIGRAERISLLKELAAQNISYKEMAEYTALSYSYVYHLCEQNNIKVIKYLRYHS